MTRKTVTEILQCSVIFLDCSGRSSNRGNKAPIYHFYIQNLFKPCYWALFFVIDLGFISVHENKQTNKQANETLPLSSNFDFMLSNAYMYIHG